MRIEQRFLLDVSRLVWRRWVGRLPTGIDRVCLAYLDHYGPRSEAVIHGRGAPRILGPKTSRRLFDLLAGGGRDFRGDLVRTLGAEAFRSRGRAEPGQLYLNVGHTGLDRPGFLRWVRDTGVRPVYMVHDLIPITHPEYCRAGEAERHRQRMETILRTAAGVVGNSQVTIDVLGDFAARLGLAAPPAVAAWLGSEIRSGPGPSTPDRPHFVILGTIEARKNHRLLLELWERLIRQWGANAPRLLVIGQRGWEADEAFALLDRLAAPGGTVEELSRCDDRQVSAHLMSARALLFPSLVEGYGLPLVEALAAGTPVIASDLPVFREIGQGVPEMLDPLDSNAWERMILDYAGNDSAGRKDQLERLAGYRPPKWAGHFRTVDRWLDSL